MTKHFFLSSFRKLKSFWPLPPGLRLVRRDKPLEPRRRADPALRDRVERHKEELEEIEVEAAVEEEELPPNVLWERGSEEAEDEEGECEK